MRNLNLTPRDNGRRRWSAGDGTREAKSLARSGERKMQGSWWKRCAQQP